MTKAWHIRSIYQGQPSTKGKIRMIRRFGDAPDKNQAYQLRPGAYVILPRDDKLLVTYQADPHNEFQLPGGGIDPGESPLQALYRETLEETGWRIDKPRKLGTFRRFIYMPEYNMKAEKICHIFVARPTLKISAPVESGHTDVWLDPMIAVEVLANEGDRFFLRQFLT